MKRLILFLFAVCAARATVYTFPTNTVPPSLQPGVVTGVIGGIPAQTHGLNATLAPYNADNTGATDATSAIGNALAAVAASGGTYDFVYLPSRGPGVPGIYRIDGEFGMPAGVTIRGDGVGEAGDVGLTILDGRSVGHHVVDIGNADPAFGTGVNTTIAVGLTDGLTRGSTRLTLASSAGFVAGRFIKIKIPNETAAAMPIFQVDAINPYVRYFLRQVTNVVDGTHVDITPAIPVDLNYNSVPVQQGIVGPTSNVGVEDLQVDGSNIPSPGTLLYAIFAGNTVNCWLKNVRVTNFGNAGVFWDTAINCEIRHCRAEELSGGTNHGGYLLQDFTGGLIEDNIGVLTNPCVEFNFCSDTTLIDYNYLDQSIGSALDIHDGWASFIGVDGNFLSNASLDSYFEGNSEFTFFRNNIPALFNNSEALNPQGFGLSLGRFSRKINVVGNIGDAQGWTWANSGFGFGFPPGGAPQGTVSPINGTWWHDYDTSTHQPFLWKGVLTTRTDNTTGVITFDNAGEMAALRTALDLAHETNNMTLLSGVTPYGKFADRVHIYDLTGTVASFDTASASLPAASTPVAVIGGSPGFYELDLDAEATSTQAANWTWMAPAGIISGQALAPGVTLPDSLAYTAKPSWWPSDLAWPPYSPFSASSASATSIPAGRRFFLTIPPVIVGASITGAGNQIVVSLNKDVTASGATSGWAVSASGVTSTYSAIVGSTIVLNLSRVIANDEALNLSYTAPTPPGFVDSLGNPMPSKSSFLVTNGSQQSPAGQTWYYSALAANADGIYTYQFTGVVYMSPVVIPRSGLITKMSILWGNVNFLDHALKIGVYEAAGNNFVTSNAAPVNVTPPGPSIPQIVTLSSTHISAGTYLVGPSITANNDPQMQTVSAVGAGAFKIYFDFDFSAFPVPNLGTPSATQTQSLIVGLLLTPDNTSQLVVPGTLKINGTIKLP